MGLSLFGCKNSFSSYDGKNNKRPIVNVSVSPVVRVEKIAEKPKKLPNPNPNNYKILNYERINDFLLLEILYPDCDNYEGRKILLFKNITLKQLFMQRSIDPHFSGNKKFHSPVARFEPTVEGWKMGKYIAVNFK